MSIGNTMFWYDGQMASLEKYIDDYLEGEKEAKSAQSRAVDEYNKLASMARRNGGYISASEDRAAREYYISKVTDKYETKMAESIKQISTNVAEYTNKMAECLKNDDVESVLFLYEKLEKLVNKTSNLIKTVKTIKKTWDTKVNSDSKILEYKKKQHVRDAKRQMTELKTERRLVKGKYEAAKANYESLIKDYEDYLKNKMIEIKTRFKALNLELEDLTQKYSDNLESEIILYRQLNEAKGVEQFDIREKLAKKNQEKDRLYKDIRIKQNEKNKLRKDSRKIINILEEEILETRDEMNKHQHRLDECELGLDGYDAIIKEKSKGRKRI